MNFLAHFKTAGFAVFENTAGSVSATTHTSKRLVSALGIFLLATLGAQSQTVTLVPDSGSAPLNTAITGNVLTNDSCVAGTTNGAAIRITFGTNGGVTNTATAYFNVAHRTATNNYDVNSSSFVLSTNSALRYTGNIRFVDAIPGSTNFVGNNVNGYLYLPGSTNPIPGTASRQEKLGGTTRAFYFVETGPAFDPKTQNALAYMMIVPTYETNFVGGWHLRHLQ